MLRLIQHIYILPLAASALLSLKSFRLGWAVQYKMFSALLWLILFTECTAILWKYVIYNQSWSGHYSKSNIWIYNIFLIPQYLGYCLVFYQAAISKKRKKLIIAAAVIFTIVTVANMLFFQPVTTVSSFAIIAASLLVIFLSTGYFEELRKQETITRLSTHPMAWISLGAFIFHAANLPYIISLNYLIGNNMSLAVALFYIYMGLNCVMYTLYSTAFLCTRLPRK